MAAATNGANVTPNSVSVVIQVNMNSQLLQPNKQQFVMTLSNIHDQNLSALLVNYFNSLKTQKFCAKMEEHLTAVQEALRRYEHDDLEASFEWKSDALLVHEFLSELKSLYREQFRLRSKLASLDATLVEKLNAIGTWKKSSAVFFTGAAATTAAAANANSKKPLVKAAAAATVVFCALGKWINSALKKRESAVWKTKEIIRVTIMCAESSIEDLREINAVAERLQLQIKSVSESEMVEDDVEVREKMAAVKKRFEELRGKANEFGQDMKWAKRSVLETVVHSD